jgi:hypothetical protein
VRGGVLTDVEDERAAAATRAWRDAVVRLGECTMAWQSSVQEELDYGEAARANCSGVQAPAGDE